MSEMCEQVGEAGSPVHVVVCGVSHHETPIELRERLYVDLAGAQKLALELAEDGGEALVLSTCNRTELYLAHPDLATATERATAALSRLSSSSESEIAATVYTRSDEEAALHLFRVAAGLHSMVAGEGQILGQVRAAFEAARAAGATGSVLNRLFSRALRAGKRVRTETAIAENPASVSSAAAELAARVFGDLEGKRILLLGAGKMSELAAVNLLSRGVASVVVANRTPEKAAPLAARFGGRGVGFSELGDELARADVVISSTSAPEVLVSAKQAAQALRRRGGKAILFVDIAVPRDLDPAINDLPGAYLYDIDDLDTVVSESVAGRLKEAEQAEAIVREEARRFREWQLALAVLPAIASLRRRAEEIRATALARAESQLGGLTPSDRRLVETLTAQIVNTLLHAPTVAIKQAAALPDGTLYAGALEHLFGLEEDLR